MPKVIKRNDKISFNARLQTFAKWPRSSPEPQDLASAGFFFNPSRQAKDSVTCFHCLKSLDGWHEEDDAFKEHIDHAPQCAWAQAFCLPKHYGASANPWNESDPDTYPSSSVMIKYREETFNGRWPHQGKRGFFATPNRLARAGFCYTPEDADDDTVTCVYCQYTLSHWGPKDNPLIQHKDRNPDCACFTRITKLRSKAPVTKAKTCKPATHGKSAKRKAAHDADLEDMQKTDAQETLHADIQVVETSNVNAASDLPNVGSDPLEDHSEEHTHVSTRSSKRSKVQRSTTRSKPRQRKAGVSKREPESSAKSDSPETAHASVEQTVSETTQFPTRSRSLNRTSSPARIPASVQDPQMQAPVRQERFELDPRILTIIHDGICGSDLGSNVSIRDLLNNLKKNRQQHYMNITNVYLEKLRTLARSVSIDDCKHI